MYTLIELDKTRNMRLNMRALSMVEKKLGITVANLNMDKMSMEAVATIIWAGLMHEDNTLTVEKVMDLIDEFSNVKTAMNKMMEAFSEAFPEDKEEPKKEKN